MKNKKKVKLAICKFGKNRLRWMKKDRRYVLLSDAELDKKLKLSDSMMAKDRRKARKAFEENCEIVAEATISGHLKKAPCHVPHTRDADLPVFLRQAVLALMGLFSLFPGTSFGIDFVADILCGFRCCSLRKVEPALVFRTDIASKSNELKEVLIKVCSQLVVRTKWTGDGCKIRQKTILDFSAGYKWLADFSHLDIKFKRRKKVSQPVDYSNSAVLGCHADKVPRDDLLKYTENCYHILLDCAKSTAPHVLNVTGKDLKCVDMDAVERFSLKTSSVAVLLRHWTDGQSKAWAEDMVSRAKQKIGSDSRFIRVSYDPVILRKAVRSEVLLDFLKMSRDQNLLKSEEFEAFVQRIGGTDIPEPILRKAEDPEVVISVVRHFIQENPEKIAQKDELITPKSGYLAAWRIISRAEFCVFEENTFFLWYRSQVKGDDTIDNSIFKADGFDLIILKGLSAACKIKPRSETDSRYTYNLYAKGPKNRINVVAFFKEQLLPSEEVRAGD